MSNINLENLKEELNRLKKTAPKDGEAKYREYRVKKRVGKIFKKEIIEKEQGELIEIGDYITLNEFARILSEFLEYFSVYYNEVKSNIINYAKCDGICIEIVDGILILTFKFEDDKKVVKINIKSGLPSVVEETEELLSNCDIRKEIFNLLDYINFYDKYLLCSSEEVKINEFTSVEIKNVDIRNFGKNTPTLNVKFGELGYLILSFNAYNCYIYDYEILPYSKNIEIKVFLTSEAFRLINEIFIPKDKVKGIIDVANKYKEFILLKCKKDFEE